MSDENVNQNAASKTKPRKKRKSSNFALEQLLSASRVRLPVPLL